MKNAEHIEYTYKHRKLVMYLAKKYFTDDQELQERMKNHDLDKIFMYLLYDKKNVQKTHRKFSSHHDNDLEKTYVDYVEMVLDWESARYTKPDKPLNAFDTLYHYYPHMEESILPILRQVGIDKSNLPMESDVVDYVASISQLSYEDIKNEIKDEFEMLLD